MTIEGVSSRGPQVGRVALAGAAPNQDPLLKASREFESLFLQQLLKEARQANAALSGAERSFDRDVYEGWQDEQFASSMSLAGGIGLAETIYRQLAGPSTAPQPRPNGEPQPEAAPKQDSEPEGASGPEALSSK